MKQATILLFMILQLSCSVKQTPVKKVKWTDSQIVAKDAKRMDFFRFANANISSKYVIRDLALPTKGGYGSSIKWSIPKSEKALIINPKTGEISPASKDEVILLTAHFSKGKAVSIRNYKLTIKKRYPILISFYSVKQPYLYFSKNGGPWQLQKMLRKTKNWWKWRVKNASEVRFKFSSSIRISSALKESSAYRTSSKNCYVKNGLVYQYSPSRNSNMKDISVLTLNLHTYQEKDSLEKLNRVADLIAKLKPAFVCLQECAQHKDAKLVTDLKAPYQQVKDGLKKDNMAYIISARLQKKYGISYNYYWSWAHYGWGVWEEGVAVMTPYKIKEAEVRYISEQKTRTSIHSRIATYVSADIRGKGRFNVFSVHTSWWNSGLPEQIKAVKQFVKEKAKNKPVSSIINGDFNANAGGEGYKVLVGNKVLPLTDSYGELNPTGFDDSTISGGGRIDYIFYYPAKSLKPIVSQLCFREKSGPQAKVSDHYGVITRFKIP